MRRITRPLPKQAGCTAKLYCLGTYYQNTMQDSFLGVPLVALGSGCFGVRRAPSRLARRDRPFGAPSA